MVKGITKEEFDRIKPKCNCPDHEEIPWKDSYRKYGYPKYIVGHTNKGKKFSEEHKSKISKSHVDTTNYIITKEEFEILKPCCECPCNEPLEWQEWYRWEGVPKYKHGHHLRKNAIVVTEEEFNQTKPHLCQCSETCTTEIVWSWQFRTRGIPKYAHGHNLKCLPIEAIIKKGESISKAKTGVKRPNMCGKNHPMYGKHPISWNKGKKTPEFVIQKISASRLGIKQRQETIKKISDTMKGIVRTEEHQHNLNESLKNTYRNGRKLVIGSKCPYVCKDGSTVIFRSSWELEFAKYLDSINELWYYEFWTFDLGNTTYTPDFYLPRRELFVEIKGWWYNDISKEKFERFLDEYCFENIILIKHSPPYSSEDLLFTTNSSFIIENTTTS